MLPLEKIIDCCHMCRVDGRGDRTLNAQVCQTCPSALGSRDKGQPARHRLSGFGPSGTDWDVLAEADRGSVSSLSLAGLSPLIPQIKTYGTV